MSKVESADDVAAPAPVAPSLEMNSVALQRLIEEVRTSEPVATANYNRTHNRHNR
ncbi:YhhA family cyclophane-containing RiPP [Streptomyces sp. CA-111067]|uniref:YhhA family cyclophane-containing RiPP n=1 Tax=Streptomyces sp. CA-111067 TaxID=3240046 RepID=UPI003D9880EB